MPYAIKPWAQIAQYYQSGTVILGNGASISVSPSFNYISLLGRAFQGGLLTADVADLFRFFNTHDFELVLRLVWQASNVNKALQILDKRTHDAYLNIKKALIKAVREVHPEYDCVSARLPNMYHFLKGFDTVLSLNYDLLVYWAMTYGLNIQDGHSFKDCFRCGRFDDNWKRFRDPYIEQEYTNTLVFYPHGSLALCRDVVEQESKIQSTRENLHLLETILKKWDSERYVPLFVSEGTTLQKVSSIQNSHYLSTVYREVLTSQRSTLTLYGWGIGEQDWHLLKRMRESGIQRVAISVFQGDQNYRNYSYWAIQNCLGSVDVDFFDSESSEF